MGGPGFAKLGNHLIQQNKALRDMLRRKKNSSGQNIDGKKAVKFGKASPAVKARIKADKAFVQQQIRFRIGVLLTILILGLLLLFLFLSFG